MQAISTLLLVLVTLAPCSNAEDHTERYMVDALYDTTVNFTCNPKGLEPNITSSIHRIWLLPTGEVLEVGMKDHRDRVILEDEGGKLSVKKVNDEDFGIYYCVVYVFTAQKYMAIQYGINVNGPYFGDLMKQYYDNIITACAAGAVCFVVMGTFCFCYNRHQARGDKQCEADKAESAKAAAAQDGAQKAKTQYANPAYVADEVDDAGSKFPPPPPDDEGRQVQQELQDVVANADDSVAAPSVTASAELAVKTKM